MHEEKNKHQTKNKEDDSYKIDKVMLWQVASVILGILLIASVYTKGFGLSTTDTNTKTAQVAQAAKPAAAQPQAKPSDVVQPTLPNVNMKIAIDDDSVEGDPNAKVTIVEWSDYQCPFCAKFYNGAYQDIKKEYIDTGKVKLVLRDFPLSFHQNAQKAAEAAECAGEQGKYYEMHDLLFEKGVSGGVTSFKQFASELGLDQLKFDTCLDSGSMASEVQKDMQDGQKYGVRGTPGFLVNGQLISGAQPFSAFKQVIDAELAK